MKKLKRCIEATVTLFLLYCGVKAYHCGSGFIAIEQHWS